MLLEAKGLFRLDVVLQGDTLRTVVRNLSNGELDMTHALGATAPPGIGFGEISAYEPGQARVEFALADGQDRVDVAVMVAALRFAERGTTKLTAQAIVRQAPPR
jgi:hypothetical protein